MRSSGLKSQATSALGCGGVSAVMGSSDLDAHTLGGGGAPGNQLSCSLPSGANRSILESVCVALSPGSCASCGLAGTSDCQRQPPLSVVLTYSSLNRSNDVGRRNCEENSVLPKRCGCRSTTLTRRHALRCDALCLSRYRKTGVSAESQPPSKLLWNEDWIICQSTGRSPVLLRCPSQLSRRSRRIL